MNNYYYSDKIESLRKILGAKSVLLFSNYLEVDEKVYPIVDDVIIMIDDSRYPKLLREKLGNFNEKIFYKNETIFAPEIQDHYSKFWEEWSGFHERYQREFNEYFDLVNIEDLKGKSICDLGCGMGRWAYMLAEKVELQQITLVDFSDAIFTARKLFQKNQNAIFIMSDILNLPFKKNSFDFLMSLGVLHHLPDNCLDVIKRLKPLAPKILVYLYYALDNKPIYYRWLLKMYTPIRKITYKFSNPIFKNLFSWIAVFIFYYPFICLGFLLKPFGLSKYVPLYDEHAWSGIGGIRHSAYDRFFTKIEQRVTRAQILTLKGEFTNVTVADGQAYWHFLCER